MKDQKTLPLRPLELNSKPRNQRALAWSSDAELAVAADDSVYIFLPEFPIIDPNSLPEGVHDDGPAQLSAEQRHDTNGMSVLPAGLSSSRGQGEDNDDELLSSDSEADMDVAADADRDLDGDVSMEGGAPGGNTKRVPDNRQQFADGCRHITVSRPSPVPEINAHIWNIAGKGMPVMHVGGHDQGGFNAETVPVNGNRDHEGRLVAGPLHESGDADGPIHEANPHPGAGVGVIGSAGSSLNHVVAIEWSPAGLGRNLRPVLGVLTGCGSLIVYGEGSPLPFGSTARPLKSAGTKGQSAVRNLESWLALWAVGENFVVPGQEEYGYGEYIKAFAWCREIGPGKALLAYMNDVRELVILCVGTAFKKLEDGLEETVWNVKEVIRVETSGPHGQADIFDPDFLPGGSSYCIRWSPWLKDGATWSCLLSYMDKNYIGFRKVTLDAAAWISTETPAVKCDPQDWDGRCLHLGADAFLEFENMVWNFKNKQLCRGFIATPFIAEPFEVDIAHGNPHRPKSSHSTDHCKTTYSTEPITNPITGLVVHPVILQTVSPSVIPLYTAVRLSATATNKDWWESSLPQRRNRREEPQWATEIRGKITAKASLSKADEVGDGGSESGDDGVERDEDAEKADEEQSDDEDEDDNDANGFGGSGFQDVSQGQVDTYTNPEVYPQRMLLWGIAASPGGGSTAVLTSSQRTQKPERGTWNHYHSQILFEYSTRRARPSPRGEAEPNRGSGEEADENSMEDIGDVEGLSTEARLWEWLYGSGPGVPALTYYASPTNLPTTTTMTTTTTTTTITVSNPRLKIHQAEDANTQSHRDRIKSLFTSLVASQTCEICADGRTKLLRDIIAPNDANKERQLDCVCEQGHRFAICGASSLAITKPGSSRCCGVCQSRCLYVEVLAGMLAAAGKEDEAEMVRRGVNGDVCVQCSGKYLD